ncbi:hypothetical protein KP509_36G000200 [Ceratopteris richardii]|uniref:Myb-like domain-containing protein n=1 Tax=Ceratopteris richardii TaxID=49495 RepID=A0A8T2Q8U9_CERRI|nr:hypothetical protein KP509_36G000200 [Ceratopteris richardii]
MQQGGQYDEALPTPAAATAASTAAQHARTSLSTSTGPDPISSSQSHILSPSHITGNTGALGVQVTPSISFGASATSASPAVTTVRHPHDGGDPSPHSYSTENLLKHQHHPDQQEQHQEFLHLHDHHSNTSAHNGLQTFQSNEAQQHVDDDSTPIPLPPCTSSGFPLHQPLKKQAMAPSISINLQQKISRQETGDPIHQASIVQQQYVQPLQQYSVGRAIGSLNPCIGTTQSTTQVKQYSHPGSFQTSAISSVPSSAPGSIAQSHHSVPLADSTTEPSPEIAKLSTMFSSGFAAGFLPSSTGNRQHVGLTPSSSARDVNSERVSENIAEVAADPVIEDHDQQSQDIQAMGDDSERCGNAGNRWPRQETLALLRVRSDMDAMFRDSSLKRPLWDEVSRKLAELGFQRSAKKCKEKFENVHKYYKRTKEGKAGRQDGKNYRFFGELEALYGNAGSNPGREDSVRSAAGFVMGRSAGGTSNSPSELVARMSSPSVAHVSSVPNVSFPVPLAAADATGGSLSSDTYSSCDYSGDEYEHPSYVNPDNKKRKRKRKTLNYMMVFFENMLKQVMGKQEQMQQRFLDALERREQDRMIREEAWKRQEMARMSRENELQAQERSLAAARDAAVVALLQKMTGQAIAVPTPSGLATITAPVIQRAGTDHASPISLMNSISPCDAIIPHQNLAEDQDPFDANSKRWPKSEVLALIKIRTSLHSQFTEPGPKGALWEEIAGGMARLGYNRNAKRCKEKWENINKYFKKAKESNKNRPENAKTCPYYHQLDALYRQGLLGSSNIGNTVRPFSHRHPSSYLHKAENHTQLDQVTSARTDINVGELTSHASSSPDKILSIIPASKQVDIAAGDVASGTIIGTTLNNPAASSFRSSSIAANCGLNNCTKDMNLQNLGNNSSSNSVNLIGDPSLRAKNGMKELQTIESVSIKAGNLQTQQAETAENMQQPRSLFSSGYEEQKVGLERDAKQTDGKKVHENQYSTLVFQQQDRLAPHQAYMDQFQLVERTGGSLLPSSGTTTIPNMLQNFDKGPVGAQGNTSTTTSSTNEDY